MEEKKEAREERNREKLANGDWVMAEFYASWCPDPVALNHNPYFFKGKAGEGIGGPHIGYDMVWPMSIMMKAFTSQDDQEIKECIKMLINTDAGTGFMHESFHKDDPANFTRAWFAWQNTLFGELILKLVNEGKLELLNNIK